MAERPLPRQVFVLSRTRCGPTRLASVRAQGADGSDDALLTKSTWTIRRPRTTLVVALVVSTTLATVGSWGIAVGMMTDCTTYYETCTADDCTPCAATSHWLLGGAVFQAMLAVSAAVLLYRSAHWSRSSRGITIGATVIVLTSCAGIVYTTHSASSAYCRPDGPGFAQSYCAIRD